MKLNHFLHNFYQRHISKKYNRKHQPPSDSLLLGWVIKGKVSSPWNYHVSSILGLPLLNNSSFDNLVSLLSVVTFFWETTYSKMIQIRFSHWEILAVKHALGINQVDLTRDDIHRFTLKVFWTVSIGLRVFVESFRNVLVSKAER